MHTATHERTRTAIATARRKANGHNDEPARPYRLWNANDKRPERWRCYSSITNAHNGATLQLRWAPLGTHIEVYDVRTWRHLGTYTKRLPSSVGKEREGEASTIIIEFKKGDGHVIVPAAER
jgi:hypothetical protein